MMKLNSIKRFQDELKINSHICFKCKLNVLIENDKSKSKPKDQKTINQLYPCMKCKRAYFCSSLCLKNSNNIHNKICEKYYQSMENINNIVNQYLASDQENI